MCFHFREPEAPDDGNTRQPGKSFRKIPDPGAAFTAICEIRGLNLFWSFRLASPNKGNGSFGFLRAIGLQPIEWRKAIELTRKPSRYVGEILDAAFREAVAVVVLLTPDDEAKLKDEFPKPHDPKFEKKLAGQARPNVLFEAGMAMGRNPGSVVLVQIGDMRPFSDIGGVMSFGYQTARRADRN